MDPDDVSNDCKIYSMIYPSAQTLVYSAQTTLRSKNITVGIPARPGTKALLNVFWQ